jgi:hypothetical protein
MPEVTMNHKPKSSEAHLLFVKLLCARRVSSSIDKWLQEIGNHQWPGRFPVTALESESQHRCAAWWHDDVRGAYTVLSMQLNDELKQKA